MRAIPFIISLLLLQIGGFAQENRVLVNDVDSIRKQNLLQLINDVRAKGCKCGNEWMEPVGPVIWDDLLEKAAWHYSLHLHEHKHSGHVGKDGSTLRDRLKRVGYSWSSCGENIATNFPCEFTVVEGWLSSPGHCRTLMHRQFKRMGVGSAGGYWVQVFGN